MTAEVLSSLASAFILGLLGSGHCVGMCGGLMGAFALGATPGRRPRSALLLGYNLGRVVSYGVAGTLLGGAGWALTQALGQWPLRLLAGGLLVVMGLYLAGGWQGLLKLEHVGQGLWARIRPLAGTLLPVASLRAAVMLGMLWGWLPCGLVYSTLLWAASQGQPAHAGLLMLAFGLGTCPLLLLTGLAGAGGQRWLRRPGIRRAAGSLLIAYGLWTCAAVVYHEAFSAHPKHMPAHQSVNGSNLSWPVVFQSVTLALHTCFKEFDRCPSHLNKGQAIRHIARTAAWPRFAFPFPWTCKTWMRWTPL